MGVWKIIKSSLIYYYITAVAFILLIIFGMNIVLTDDLQSIMWDLNIILPAVSLALGFAFGGARYYTKWGLPVYIALLSFCLSVFVYGTESWIMVFLGFVYSLIGIIVRHFVSKWRKNRK